jgi:hypothetical protein
LQILEVREAVLQRIFKVRKEEVKICTDQNIRQEEMLNTIRSTAYTLIKMLQLIPPSVIAAAAGGCVLRKRLYRAEF